MKKTAYFFILLLLLTLIACSEDNAGNDPAAQGTWAGYVNMGNGPEYYEFVLGTESAHQYNYTDQDLSIMAALTNNSSYGTYEAIDGIFTIFSTHSYSYDAYNWETQGSSGDDSGLNYTISDIGGKTVMTLTTNSDIIYLTNIGNYAMDATMVGTWVMVTDISANETMYGTNFIYSDGSFTRVMYIENDTYSGDWAGPILQDSATGTISFNADLTVMILEDTQQSELTNNSPDAAGPLYETKSVYTRDRMPIEVDGNSMIAYSSDGEMHFTKE